MSQTDFDYWVGILKAHFPTHRVLSGLGTDFVPFTPEEAAVEREAHARAHPVVEMKDQDGARRAFPDFESASDWVDMMTPGDSLVFLRGDGGVLQVSRTGSDHSVRCVDAAAAVLADAQCLDDGQVREAIRRYLDGDVAACVSHLCR